MKDKTCREFEEWLGRLPLSRPSEEMESHLASCPRCRKLFDSLAPLVHALSEIPSPVKLSEDKIKSLVTGAEKEALRMADRRTFWRLSLKILIGLPFIIFIHWIWLSLSSMVLAELLSPLIAQIFSTFIIITSSLVAALLLGAIPLLWTGLRRNLLKEICR